MIFFITRVLDKKKEKINEFIQFRQKKKQTPVYERNTPSIEGSVRTIEDKNSFTILEERRETKDIYFLRLNKSYKDI